MKKIVLYTVAMIALSQVMMSCSRDEDMIFDDSAAIRLDKAKAEYADILCENGGKWEMEYFSRDEEPGYIYTMTFDKNGSVVICGNNSLIGNVFSSEMTAWAMKGDYGVVLSFDLGTRIFHVFAEPENFDDGTGIDYTGKGHSGDYEFIILDISDDHNTITMKGKKHGMPIFMRRLPADTDDKAYIQAALDNKANMFSSVIQDVYLKHQESGETFVVSGGYTGMISIYPQSGDPVTQTESSSVIFTPDGMRLVRPLQVSLGAAPTDSITIYSFALQPDGTLMCTDEYAKGSVIDGPEFGPLLVEGGYQWLIKDSKSSDDFKALYDEFVAQLKDAKVTLKEFKFIKSESTGAFQLAFVATVKKGLSQSQENGYVAFDTAVEPWALTLSYKDADSRGKDYLAKYPALQQIVDMLCAGKYEITAPSRLVPDELTLKRGNEYIVVNVK